MTETELWEWMMDGNYPPGHMTHFVKLKRRAFAVLARDVIFNKWQGHDKKDKVETILAGTKVKVVMASRMGDVGITDNLKVDNGYHYRVNCIEGEWDVMGDGKELIPLKPEGLLLNIEPVEDPNPDKVKKAFPDGELDV